MTQRTAARLELICIDKAYGNKAVLADLNLTIHQGELVSLLGPSGCGKSTTLRIIGGFIEPDKGEILLEGRRLNQVEPEHRPVSTVFQSYALFPHMSVLENVMYGLRCRHITQRVAEQQALKMLDAVDLREYVSKMVNQLSGGQQQRVALARVLVLSPQVLLLDEPFSNLDAGLRQQMREEVRRLQRLFGLTTLFVTHDYEEAMELSDRIAVMQAGRIVQIDTPRKIYSSPASRYVAECVGRVNVVQLEGGQILVRPEHVRLSRRPTPHRGKIVSSVYLGMITRFQIDLQGQAITADIMSSPEQDYQIGETIHLTFSQT